MSKREILIYCDGACFGNPGYGGWGAVVVDGDNVNSIHGGNAETTNNKMEMTAAIEALKFVDQMNSDASIKVYTDSMYLKNGITSWIHGWKASGWKKKAGGDVKNVELWKELDSLSGKLSPSWDWIKGHSGDKYNEMADALAKKAMSEHS